MGWNLNNVANVLDKRSTLIGMKSHNQNHIYHDAQLSRGIKKKDALSQYQISNYYKESWWKGKQIVVSLKKRKEVFELKLHMQPKLIRGEKKRVVGGTTNMSSFRAACH